MSWILAGIYCGLIWLVFAKLRLLRLSLPIAIGLASIGPSLIIALLLCAQYLHPFTQSAIVIEQVDPIIPQLSRPGRVTRIFAEPNQLMKAGEVLFEIDKVPYENAVERGEAALEQSKKNVDLAKASVAVAQATLDRAEADLAYATSDRDRNEKLRSSNAASQDELERSLKRYEQAAAAMSQAEESVTQARLSVDVAQTQVMQAEVALRDARYDLSQTTAVAPADGYVTNLQLRPGALVGGGAGAVMTFVRDSEDKRKGIVVATFTEKNFLRIKPGQYAEVAMDGYPGQILTGRVLNTINVSGTGQLVAGGVLPSVLMDGKPTKLAVRLQLDDRALRLPGGAQGQAAIYTEDIQIAGIPIMFLIRANSWMNYLF